MLTIKIGDSEVILCLNNKEVERINLDAYHGITAMRNIITEWAGPGWTCHSPQRINKHTVHKIKIKE